MTPQERQQLKALFVATAAYYGQEIPDAALRLYVEDLDDLAFPSVAAAMKELRRDPKQSRCPLPATVRARMHPESDPESEAVVIASRIVGCISRIGPYQAGAARLALGPVGWAVVQMEGGWETICEQLNYDNMPSLKAQWRNLARSLIERGVTGFNGSGELEYKPRDSGGLTPLADIRKLIPDGSGGA